MSGTYHAEDRDLPDNVIPLSTGGLRLVSSRTIKKFNPDWLINMDVFAADRPLNQNWVDTLIDAMRRGTFRPEQVKISTCLLKTDGKTYRMNGQHTAWAVKETGIQYRFTHLHYEADTEDDMRQLYASIDRGRARTASNVLESYLYGIPSWEKVSKAKIRLLGSAFKLWYWQTKAERQKHDSDDVAYHLKGDHYDLAMKVQGMLKRVSKKDNPHAFRAPVVAAMFATCNKAPEVSKAFWGPVCTGIGISTATDPRLKLRSLLQQSSINTGSGSRTEKKHVSAEYMYRACITAWNAYRDKRKLRALKVVSENGRRPALK